MATDALRLIVGRPPCYDQVVAAVGHPPVSAVFTWGETMYALTDPGTPSLHLVRHEQTHVAQQALVGGPQAWWDRWCADKDFRCEQELAAFRVQYLTGCAERPNRAERRLFLRDLARSLSSRMYGRVISMDQAQYAIRTPPSPAGGAPEIFTGEAA